MNVPRYALLAARLLRPTDAVPGAAGEDRARGLRTIERALGAPRRASRRSWSLSVAASVAAGLVGWVVAGQLDQPPTQVQSRLVSVVASPLRMGASFLDSTGELPLDPGSRLLVGGRIATAPGGGARLELSTGTRLELEALTILTLQSQDALQRFALAQGVLEATVAKLMSGERFVIDTPDAQVEVRGTAFRLEVVPTSRACGDGNRTLLDVREGVVEVRAANHSTRLGAGQHWPRDCEAPELEPARSATGVAVVDPGALGAAEPRVAETDLARRAVEGRRRRPHQPERSLIGEQNALFQRALRAQKRGETEPALDAYIDLVERFPSSPLAENALVARMRLLVAVDLVRARREAAGYLERYPRGFARAEAQRISEGRW